MILDSHMPNIKSEEEFGNLFIDSPSLTGLFESTNLYFIRELRTSLGIPDYILLSKDDFNTLNYFAKNYDGIQLSGKYATVISYIAKEEIVDTQVLSGFLRQRKNDLLRSLEELQEWGVVQFEDTNKEKVTINANFEIPQIHSVAIELKLSSWEKALWQAIRNSGQFMSSFVVMPSNKLHLLNSKIDLFRANGIGTAVLDVDSLNLTPIHQPINTQVIKSRYYLEALGSLIKNIPNFEQTANYL